MFNLIPWKKKGNGDGGTMVEREFHPLARLRDEFDSLLDRYWHGQGLPEGPFGFSRGWGLDLADEEKEFVVRAEAPGFEPDDFDVQILRNQLIVKAEHKEEQKEEGSSSFHYGKLHRMITLPDGIEPDKVEARYHSGVLEIRLPKGPEAVGKRIAVKPE
jgi:HSP20 family protein